MSETTVPATIEPGLNMPTLLDDPDLFFYDVSANEDGTLTSVGHGDPRRTTSKYAHLAFFPEMTAPGRIGYLSLSPKDGEVHIVATDAEKIVVTTGLGVITFSASVVVVFHRSLDDEIKGYYEGVR